LEIPGKRRKYAFVRHYDEKKYLKEKKLFEKELRKRKPEGKIQHSITLFQATRIEIDEEWYQDYFKLIKKIYQKWRKIDYKKFKFKIKNGQGLFYWKNQALNSYDVSLIASNLIQDGEYWKKAVQILRDNGFPDYLIGKRIASDIWWTFEFKKKANDKDVILEIILLDERPYRYLNKHIPYDDRQFIVRNYG